MKILLNGCFDCLHNGHIKLLRIASQFGHLVVGLNSDESVRSLKGSGRPIEPWSTRAHHLFRLFGCEVVEFHDADELVRSVKPDIIVRGWDQTVSEEDRKHIVVIAPKLTDDSTTRNLYETNQQDRALQ